MPLATRARPEEKRVGRRGANLLAEQSLRESVEVGEAEEVETKRVVI